MYGTNSSNGRFQTSVGDVHGPAGHHLLAAHGILTIASVMRWPVMNFGPDHFIGAAPMTTGAAFAFSPDPGWIGTAEAAHENETVPLCLVVTVGR